MPLLNMKRSTEIEHSTAGVECAFDARYAQLGALYRGGLQQAPL
jgi:hypothetical protein